MFLLLNAKKIANGGTRTRNPSLINSSNAIAGKELSSSSWCIASLYIYHFSTVVDFSSEKYSGSTGHRNSSDENSTTAEK